MRGNNNAELPKCPLDGRIFRFCRSLPSRTPTSAPLYSRLDFHSYTNKVTDTKGQEPCENEETDDIQQFEPPWWIRVTKKAQVPTNLNC